jgi:hypothetical protein
MSPSPLLDSLATAGLALLSVSLWTGRVALTAKGRKTAGALMAALEATVFVVAFSRLLTGLDSPIRIIAYAAGVAGGTLLALTVDSAVNPQVVKVDIVDGNGPDRVLTTLHREGWPTTVLRGEGLAAPVDMAAPDAFWTVTSVRQVGAGAVPPGFTQVARDAPRWSPQHRTTLSDPTRSGSSTTWNLGSRTLRYGRSPR